MLNPSAKYAIGDEVVPVWMEPGHPPFVVGGVTHAHGDYFYYLKPFGWEKELGNDLHFRISNIPEDDLEPASKWPDLQPYKINITNDKTGEQVALLEYTKNEYDMIVSAALKLFITQAVDLYTGTVTN